MQQQRWAGTQRCRHHSIRQPGGTLLQQRLAAAWCSSSSSGCPRHSSSSSSRSSSCVARQQLRRLPVHAAAVAPGQEEQPPAAAQQGAEAFPPYQVLRKGDTYDLRLYATPYAVLEVDYTRREEGFLALGAYKDGANAAGTRFSLTQPVVMTHYPGGTRKVMQLMVGSPRGSQQQQQQQQAPPSVAELPAPTDQAVRLGVAGGEVVAVMRFEGNITPDAAAAMRQRLADALAADGLALAPAEAEGLFRVAQYGQIFTLATRLNEMMLAVQI